MVSTDITTAYFTLCDAAYETWKNSIDAYVAKTTPYWATFFK